MSKKKELDKYRKYLDEEADKFKVTAEDLSNLYDMMYMIDDDTYEILRLNNMKKWFLSFFQRVEKVVVPEVYS